MKRRLLQILSVLLGLVALALLCGSAYEALSRRALAERFSLRGERVDIGGRRLLIDCRGAGSPTVVFETGFDPSGALGWSLVHEGVAEITRACTYSRAGIMASDPSDGERDASAVAEDLHALLARAGERPPFVLVAHSLGGIYAMAYARKFGADVSGLVLVDSSHPDMMRRMADAGLHLKDPRRGLALAAARSWTGVVRAIVGSADAESAYLPISVGAMLKEGKALERSFSEARALRQLGGRPLFVLSAGKLSEGFMAEAGLTAAQGLKFQAMWRGLQDDLASWSTQSQHEFVGDATHRIHEERPDRVVSATRWVVAVVRTNTAH